MQSRIVTTRAGVVLLGAMVLTLASCKNFGFQSPEPKEILPPAIKLEDDVQFFPNGQNDRLAKMRADLERYKVEREAIEDQAGGESAP